MVERFRDGRPNRQQKGGNPDVFKRTVPGKDGNVMRGSHVLIYGRPPRGSVDPSALQAEIADFTPRPNGKLPRRILPSPR